VAILAVFYESLMTTVNFEHALVSVLGNGGYQILGTVFFIGMMVMLYRLATKKD
jgi:hypothetical protein